MMQTMTFPERLAARMRGEPVDKIPSMSLVMQFAADQIGKPLAQLVSMNYKAYPVEKAREAYPRNL